MAQKTFLEDFSTSIASKRLLKRRLLSFAVFGLNCAVLCCSIAFGYSQVSQQESTEISKSFVKKLLLFTIICTAIAIITQSWIYSDFSESFNDKLRQFDKVFEDDSKAEKKSWKTSISLCLPLILNTVLVLLCCGLSATPLLFDKEYGIWEILLYSIFLLKFSAYQYTLKVNKICCKILNIRTLIEKIAENHEKQENFSLQSLKIFNANYKESLEDEKKVIRMIRSFNVVQSMVESLNNRYGFSILCIVFSSFLTITYCGYNFFIEIETRKSQSIIVGEKNML